MFWFSSGCCNSSTHCRLSKQCFIAFMCQSPFAERPFRIVSKFARKSLFLSSADHRVPSKWDRTKTTSHAVSLGKCCLFSLVWVLCVSFVGSRCGWQQNRFLFLIVREELERIGREYTYIAARCAFIRWIVRNLYNFSSAAQSAICFKFGYFVLCDVEIGVTFERDSWNFGGNLVLCTYLVIVIVFLFDEKEESAIFVRLLGWFCGSWIVSLTVQIPMVAETNIAIGTTPTITLRGRLVMHGCLWRIQV